MSNMKRVEILAPCGSEKSVYAALNCGADAVYVGGQLFGARAYADNPDVGQLKELLKEVHLRGKRLYLTVNTLLKDKEINTQLLKFLEPLYEHGLDAVIVQDFGVWSVVRQVFPDLALHASTQMTVVSAEFAQMLKDAGASRVVPARELALAEIKRIKDMCDIEVETFVHGALCYCYSGQCLMSSMIGGRSGNRGRCAQPCRLPYQFYTDGQKLKQNKGQYLISPKDICTLQLIPELVKAGIDSFKIEGRMKNPEYTALVTSMYRKYTDLYSNVGDEGFSVSDDDTTALMDLYNRGGFTTGYYKQHNGKDMISVQKPNHFGTPAAKVIKTQKNKVIFKALNDLDAQDVLEISDGRLNVKPYQWTLKNVVLKDSQFDISQIRSLKLSEGMICFRTRHSSMLEKVKKMSEKPQFKEKLYANLIIYKDLPVKIKISYGDISVEVTGDMVQGALNRALTIEDIKKQIGKTGDTPYVFDKIEIEMPEDVFLPLTSLNRLRRDAIEKLQDVLIRQSMRQNRSALALDDKNVYNESNHLEDVFIPKLTVLVEKLNMLPPLLENNHVSIIYLEYNALLSLTPVQFEKIIFQIHANEKKVFLATPHMVRFDGILDIEQMYHSCMLMDGVLVRNIESLLMLKNRNYDKEIIADARVYTWNKYARDFVKNLGVARLTVPEELNFQELMLRGCCEDEMIVYGYRPLMISAQCLVKTTGEYCHYGEHQLKDRIGRSMRVVSNCSGCYNLIYNSFVLNLLTEMKHISGLHPDSLRLEFTSESVHDIKKILQQFCSAVFENKTVTMSEKNFTKGHFNRGVE